MQLNRIALGVTAQALGSDGSFLSNCEIVRRHAVQVSVSSLVGHR